MTSAQAVKLAEGAPPGDAAELASCVEERLFMLDQGFNVGPHAGFQHDLAFITETAAPILDDGAMMFRAEPFYFRSLNKAWVMPAVGIIVNAAHRPIQESLNAWQFKHADFSGIPSLRVNTDGTFLAAAGEPVMQAGSVPTLYANHGGYTVYGHFLLETVTSIFALLPLIRRGAVSILLPPTNQTWPIKLLLSLGVGVEAIVPPAAAIMAFDRLIVSSAISANSTFNPGRVALAFARDILRNMPQRASGRRLFVTRKGAITTSRRQIANEDRLRVKLEALGFEAVDPSRLRFLDQVRLFAEANCVVGANGSAFANLIFAPPSTMVFNLISEEQVQEAGNWIANLTNLFQQRYAPLVCASTGEANARTISIDVDLVVDRVTRFLQQQR